MKYLVLLSAGVIGFLSLWGAVTMGLPTTVYVLCGIGIVLAIILGLKAKNF